jgi:hypothetical protein
MSDEPLDLPQGCDPDTLRRVDHLHLPDERMRFMWVESKDSRRPLNQADRHGVIDRYVLVDSVPADVRVHFDTARNLYLYAWHVYRFHAVAEQQALQAMEMALRVKLIERGDLNVDGELEAVLPPDASKKARDLKPKTMMLYRMLDHAAKMGLVRNDRIVNRVHWAQRSAEFAQSLAALEAVTALDLPEADFIPAPVVLTESDINHDWISAFIEALPSMRNGYAHGSSNIRSNVVHTFDVTSDLINQLFTSEVRPS